MSSRGRIIVAGQFGGTGMVFSISGSNVYYAGGGGGGGGGGDGGSGGSGIVIVRHLDRPQYLDPSGTYKYVPAYNTFPAGDTCQTYLIDGTGIWWAIFNTNIPGRTYWITTNIDLSYGAWTSAWRNVGSYYSQMAPTGEYPYTFSRTNELATGTVTAAWGGSYIVATNYVYWTNVYYRTQLLKIGASNDCYTATNTQHKIGYYAYATRPTGGGSNYYTNQGLSLVESNWSEAFAGGWSSSSVNPAWIVGTLATPPSAAPEVSTNAVNGSASLGFEIAPALKAVAEWQFQYCTNAP